MSLQQKESFTSPRFTLLQRQSFMEKKNKKMYIHSISPFASPLIFPRLIKQILRKQTNEKTPFSSTNQIPVRILEPTRRADSKNSVEEGATAQNLQTCCCFKRSPKCKQMKPNTHTKGKNQKHDKIKCHSEHMVGQIPCFSQPTTRGGELLV